MKQTETEKMLQNDPELDAVLDQMAEDVPPMPADFHAKWMNAVRAEAKQDAAPAEETEEKKTKALARWTRILSVAATFVFLIGGTILYRNSRGSLMSAGGITGTAGAADAAGGRTGSDTGEIGSVRGAAVASPSTRHWQRTPAAN